jgi:predicted short-subunit dehydrogenase-like oxidoreductase (DUF2520 family)
VIQSVRVIGSGRVGLAVSARLRERGVDPASGDPDLVLICVPDREIPGVAQKIEPGPWIAHVSGATPLSALDPHRRRFGVHPLQTFTLARGPEQLDGAFAACTGESDEALTAAFGFARTLGLEPFSLADDKRALYHAGASIASNFLVTLHRAASQLFEEAGAPVRGLVPLMQGTIDNGFELTGPISRGDWQTVATHLEAIRRDLPALEHVYRALAEATAA